MQFAGREPEADVSPGHWVAAALGRCGLDALLPPVFPAAARVLHPAVHYDGDDDVDVPWSAVARANGTVAHPLMEWGGITGSMDFYDEADQSPLWEGAPPRGHLPVHVARTLAAVLARHTRTPEDCFFGVWHGFGYIVSERPTLALPGREHWLVRGPIGLAAANMAIEPWEQGPNLWFPADRAWYVASDIDLVSSYVGGSVDCIAEVLATAGIEAVPATPGQPVGDEADTVNPTPD